MGAHYWYGFSEAELWEAKWAGIMDLIVDTIGDPDNDPSLYKVVKIGARLVRANITPCEKPHPEKTQFGFGIIGQGGKKLIDKAIDFVSFGIFGKKMNNKAIDYDVFHSFKGDKELFTKDLAYLLDLLKIGKIRPRIFSRVGFDKLEGAWEKVLSVGGNGCVLVSP
jgi:D-arabinose 1-dehydrogenase-like Zn-dependent alcohol dehydrogenase